jgi:hypothetical protein
VRRASRRLGPWRVGALRVDEEEIGEGGGVRRRGVATCSGEARLKWRRCS